MGKDEIEIKLKHACIFLGPLKQMCNSFVTKFIDKIFNAIRKHVSPDKICDALRLCNGPQLSELIFTHAWSADNDQIFFDEPQLNNEMYDFYCFQQQ